MEGRPGFSFLCRKGDTGGPSSAIGYMIEYLPAASYRRERWKSDGGWTREIIRFPGEGEWHWRASIAEIGSDAAFSRFPGCEREIVLLAGQGMDLDLDRDPSVRLEPPYGRLRFSGDCAVNARLVEGPVIAFNLIWLRGVVETQLLHRPIVGAMLFFGEPGLHWLLYVLAGQVRTPAGVLDTGDAAMLAIEPGQRLVIEGGGELLLAKLVGR